MNMHNREEVLAEVTRNEYALENAVEEFRSDREIVLAATLTTDDGLTFQYATDDLKADREFVVEAVPQNGQALNYVTEERQADRDIVLAATTQDDDAFEYAAELHDDREFVLDTLTLMARTAEEIPDTG